MSKRFRENEEHISGSDKIFDIHYLDLFVLLENYKEDYFHFFEYAIENGYNIERKNRYGDSLLTCATINNVYQIVEFLISKGANIEHRDNDNMNALLISIDINEVNSEEQNHEEPVNELTKLLIETYKKLGLDTNCIDVDGNTPLINAVQRNNKELVKYLINEGKANIEHKNKDGNNALILSIFKNKSYTIHDQNDSVEDINDITKILLEKYKELELCVDCEDKNNNTPLSLAIVILKNTALVKMLLECGANVHHSYKNSALYMAIDTVNLIKITEAIIAYGADVNYVDKHNRTPLAYAVAIGLDKNNYMVQLLLKNGAKEKYYDRNGVFHSFHRFLNPDDKSS
jgi:ankyrin repeat protein